MATFIKIASVEVGSGGAANIDFTSIPQTYTDLKLVYAIRTSYAGIVEQLNFSFNASTSDFSGRYIFANGVSSSFGFGYLLTSKIGLFLKRSCAVIN